MPGSAGTSCGRSTTRCAGSSAPARPGGCCRATSRPGTRSTTRRGAGWRRAASRPWRTTSAPCCAWPRAARAEPSAAILDSRTLRSTPESGARAGYDGAKRQKGSKLHAAVDTLGHLLALHVTPADEQDRAQVGRLAAAVQEVTGESGRPRLRRPGLHRRGPGRGRRGQRHRPARRPHPGGQARLRPAAAQVGRRAQLRLGRPLPPPRPRLRAAAADRRRPALRRLRHPHARQGRGRLRLGP